MDAVGDTAAKKVKLIYLHDTPHGFLSLENRVTEFKKLTVQMAREIQQLFEMVSSEDPAKGEGVLDKPDDTPTEQMLREETGL